MKLAFILTASKIKSERIRSITLCPKPHSLKFLSRSAAADRCLRSGKCERVGTYVHLSLSRSLDGRININHRSSRNLIEENRVLREQIGSTRLRFSDDQRRRLAANAKKLGRRLLGEVATIVRPETMLAWRRRLIAKKYGGSAQRVAGRPRTAAEVGALIVRMSEKTANRATGAFKEH